MGTRLGKNRELQGAQSNLTWETSGDCLPVSSPAVILVHAVVAGHYCYKCIALALPGKRKKYPYCLFFKIVRVNNLGEELTAGC